MASSHSEGKCQCSVTVITWNIDGLDEKFIPERTTAVCDTVDSEKPDAVLLQEVVQQSLEILVMRLGECYEIFAPGDSFCPYFAALLVSKSTFNVSEGCFSLIDYPGSCQGRHLLMAKRLQHRHSEHYVTFLTSHLESLREYSAERKRQLRKVLTVMDQQRCTGSSVVFGGDTNLRANEVRAVPMSGNIFNAWEYCGCPEESKYTWDLERNDNKEHQWPGPPPRTQYDKLFVSREGGLLPSTFRLLGTTRLPCKVFPSDHFGIISKLCCHGNDS